MSENKNSVPQGRGASVRSVKDRTFPLRCEAGAKISPKVRDPSPSDEQEPAVAVSSGSSNPSGLGARKSRENKDPFAGGAFICRVGENRLEAEFDSDGTFALPGTVPGQPRAISRLNALDLIHEGDREYALDAVRRCICSGKPVELIVRRNHPGGQTTWMKLRLQSINEQNEAPLIQVFFSNISEENTLYRAILDGTDRIVHVCDAATREILFANTAACAFAGDDAQQYAGRHCYNYLWGRTSPCEGCQLDQIHDGKLYTGERFDPRTGRIFIITDRKLEWFGRNVFIEYLENATAMRQAYLDLQQSEQRYDLAIRSADLAIWEYDVRHYKITSVNKVAEQKGLIAGMENVPWSMIDSGYVQRTSRYEFLKLFERIFAGEKNISGEFWCRPRENQPLRRLRISCCVICGDDGKPVKAYGLALDVTLERQEQERYQREIQELMETNPDALGLFHLNLTRNLCTNSCGSSSYVRMVCPNQSLDEFMTDLLQFPADGESRGKCREVLNRDHLLAAFGSGEAVQTLEFPCKMLSGEIHWLRVVVRMARNPTSGDVEGVVYAQDIDEQVQRQRILQNITDEEYDYIGLIDTVQKKFSLCYVGKKAPESTWRRYQECRNYDYAAFGAIGSKIWVHPGDREEFLGNSSLEKLEQELRENNHYTFTIRGAGQDTLSYKQFRYSYLDESRRYIVLKQLDVTDIYRQESTQMQRLQDALDRAQRATEEKSRFLSNASHDMRTPLSGVIGFTNLALEADSPGQMREYVEKIKQTSTFLLDLINDTLDLSKIESGKLVLDPRPVDARLLLESIFAAVRPSADAKHIRLEISTSCSNMGWIFVDRLRVQQIVLNLLSNAVKFTPKGGKVEFHSEYLAEAVRGSNCHIMIRDNGVGMSETFLPHAFEPFSQEDSRFAARAGTGLGLSIVNRLTALMGGHIELSSREGKGTRFDVYLPVERVRPPAGSTGSGQDAQNLEGRTILVCEDHPVNLEIVTRILEKRGARVLCASNGKAGVEKFSQSAPGAFDAVLMDIRMPIMDGLEAAGKIRALNRPDAKRIPIVAMTANAFEEDREMSRAAGMNAHLAKPIDPPLLCSTLLNLMQTGSGLREKTTV